MKSTKISQTENQIKIEPLMKTTYIQVIIDKELLKMISS